MKNNYAHPLVRLLAYLIDVAIYVFVWLLLITVVSTSANIPVLLSNVFVALTLGLAVLPLLVAFVYVFLTSRFGGTPGQLITGIAVVNEHGKHLRWPLAFFRTFVGAIVSGTIFWLGFLWMIWDKKRQGWHDKISGSYVVTQVRLGWLVGLVVLVVLLMANAAAISRLGANFAKNGNVYQTIVKEIEKVFNQPAPTTAPLEVPPTTPSNRAAQPGV